jgi:hypothetical protein
MRMAKGRLSRRVQLEIDRWRVSRACPAPGAPLKSALKSQTKLLPMSMKQVSPMSIE